MNPLVNVNNLLENQTATLLGVGERKAGCVSLNHTKQKGAEIITEIVKGLTAGNEMHFFTTGAWSQHELLIALTEITGPCKIYLSTYALSETSARTLQLLKQNATLQELHCLIDNRVDTRSAGSLQLLQSISDSCVLSACHAKATVLVGSYLSVAVIGSANYTENNRLECGLATTDQDACDFHRNWIIKHLEDGK